MKNMKVASFGLIVGTFVSAVYLIMFITGSIGSDQLKEGLAKTLAVIGVVVLSMVAVIAIANMNSSDK